jgi:hypothetical protein
VKDQGVAPPNPESFQGSSDLATGQLDLWEAEPDHRSVS